MPKRNDGPVAYSQGDMHVNIREVGATDLNGSDLLAIGATITDDCINDKRGHRTDGDSHAPARLNGGIETNIDIRGEFHDKSKGIHVVTGEATVIENGQTRKGQFVLAHTTP